MKRIFGPGQGRGRSAESSERNQSCRLPSADRPVNTISRPFGDTTTESASPRRRPDTERRIERQPDRTIDGTPRARIAHASSGEGDRRERRTMIQPRGRARQCGTTPRRSGDATTGVWRDLRRSSRSRRAPRRCRAAVFRIAIEAALEQSASAAACPAAARPSRSPVAAPPRARRRLSSPSNSALARQHLVEHDAEGPDVGALDRPACPRACSGAMYAAVPRIMPRLRHRRRGQRRRDRHAAAVPSRRGPGSIAFASPKSSTFTVPSRRDLDVRGLQIAVNDALLVRGFERLGDLPRDRQRFVERQWAARDAAATGPRPRPAP